MYYKGYIAVDKNLYKKNQNFLDLYLLRKHTGGSMFSQSYLSPIGMWQESQKWMLLPFEAENPNAGRNSVTSVDILNVTYAEICHNPLDVLTDDPYSGYDDFKELCLGNIGKIWLKYIEYDPNDHHLWMVQGQVNNFYGSTLGLDKGEVKELALSKKNVIEYGLATGYNLNDNDSWNEFINLISDYLNYTGHKIIDTNNFVNYVTNYARDNSEDGYILDSDINFPALLQSYKYYI